MRTLEIIALAVTGVLAMIGLWTVSAAWRAIAKLRKDTHEPNEEKP